MHCSLCNEKVECYVASLLLFANCFSELDFNRGISLISTALFLAGKINIKPQKPVLKLGTVNKESKI